MDQHQIFLPMGALAFLTFFVEIVHLAAAHESGNEMTRLRRFVVCGFMSNDGAFSVA
jgi:hypothetical protein